MRIALTYTLFALLAIAANIGGQDVVVRIFDGANGVFLSVIVGTLIGLLVKYFLDKRYIFKFYADDHYQDAKKFALYSATGVVTTLIFWAVEFGFEYWFGTKELRYFGGIIGLSIGYLIKYRLDKKFVFGNSGNRIGLAS